MIVQADFSNAVHVVAEHLRKPAIDIVRDGAPSKIPDADDLAGVNAIADRMDASKNYAEFETAMRDGHRLGVFGYNADIGRVAQAAEALGL
jgi:hypothetical protein